MKNKTLLLTLLAFGITLPTYGQLPATPPEGKVMTFKEGIGNRGEIEIHFPEGHQASGRKVPGIIMFHGGGWKKGNRSQFRSLCHYFAGRGLVAATAHYRYSTSQPKGAEGNPKRICITDAKSAIRWFKQNADEFGIDPERIIAGGGSAGGHICLLATLNPGLNDPADPKDIDTSVVAYLLFNPALHAGDKVDSEVSAKEHLKADTAPMVAFWGTDDKWLRAWNQAHEKMEDLGIKVEWWSAPGQGHAFFNKEPWKTLTIAEADRFLVQQGLLEGEPTLPAPAGREKLVKGPQAEKN
jgi:acetyl esterase